MIAPHVGPALKHCFWVRRSGNVRRCSVVWCVFGVDCLLSGPLRVPDRVSSRHDGSQCGEMLTVRWCYLLLRCWAVVHVVLVEQSIVEQVFGLCGCVVSFEMLFWAVFLWLK